MLNDRRQNIRHCIDTTKKEKVSYFLHWLHILIFDLEYYYIKIKPKSQIKSILEKFVEWITLMRQLNESK